MLHLSSYSYLTKRACLQYVSYGIALLLSGEYLKEPAARKKIATVMIIFGSLYALFAVAQDLTSNGKLFWTRVPQFGSAIYGSYINRDHYAGLMEMLVPIPLVLSISHLLNGPQRALVGFCAILMASTIFLSASRGGMIAFIVEMGLLGSFTVLKKVTPRTVLSYLALCFLIAVLVLFVSKGQVLGRFEDLSPGIRLDINKDSLKLFSHRPILGWGLGTFSTIYPHYCSFYTTKFINAAHDDYAQLLVEMGLVGFALMGWFVIQLYRSGLRNSIGWRDRWGSAVSLSGLIGCTGIFVHSFVDFNLQIPANAALFYVLCGMTASETVRSTRSDSMSRNAGANESSLPTRVSI